MRRGLRIGLTGGIGSGKSEALNAFARAGAATLSLDDISRRLSGRSKPVYRAIVRAFGRGMLDSRGRIDRKRLGARVFRSPRLLKKLENASHPPILREMRRILQRNRHSVIVVDAPLLFEKRLQNEFDLTVVVTAKRSRRIRRVTRRDGLTEAQILRRVGAQLSDVRKRRLADIELSNDGSLKALRRAVSECQRAFDLISNRNKRVPT